MAGWGEKMKGHAEHWTAREKAPATLLEQQKEYIITKELLVKLKDAPLQEQADEISEIVCQRRYNEQAIRQKAREKALDEIEDWIKSFECYHKFQDMVLLKKIDELRQQKG